VSPFVRELPEGIDVAMRTDGRRRPLFVLNTCHEPVDVSGVPRGKDLLGWPMRENGGIALDGYGCAIIRLEG
jgi:beta-galactosidase